MEKKIYFKVTGRVQGIGFRWFVQEVARKYNLRGWVRNLDDGSVEGKAKGEEIDIEKFLIEIKTKHPLAIVKKLETTQIDEELDYSNFYIEH